MNRLLIAFFLSLALFAACRKDYDTTTDRVLGPIPTENVQASLTGRVTDPNGVPISGLTVAVAGQTLVTDDEGLFFVHKKLMDKNGTYIKVSGGGFFDAGKFAFPQLGGSAYIEIRMIQKPSPTTFQSATGGTFTAVGGGEVTIPANAIAGENGLAYTGAVQAYAVWLNPAESGTFELMPGDLRARDADGYAKILKTFGMIGVELESPSGEKLNLLPNKKASISLIVDNDLLPLAPPNIPLWHFNDTNGYWEEEGSGSLTGNRYEFEVGHFSFWNCDVPSNFIRLTGTVVDAGNNPLVGTRVVVTSQNFGLSTAYTDDEGKFSGFVPNSDALTLSIEDACGAIQYEANIGPFNTDTDLGEIEIAGINTVIVTGNLLDCDQQPLVDGLTVIRRNGSTVAVVLSDETGHFSAAIVWCAGSSMISVSAFDEDNLLQSLPLVFEQTGSTVEVGTIPVCAALDEYITLNLDGATHTFSQNLLFDFLGDEGSAQGQQGVDTVSVYLRFENYQNLQADVSFVGIYLRTPDQSLIHYFCDDCTGTNVIFTAFPAIAGEYAVGSVQGSVERQPDLTPIPYSINFRIKKQ